MSTATISPSISANPQWRLMPPPVEIKSANGGGKFWLKQAGQLPMLAAIKNLWEFTEAPDGGTQELRMHFQATTEDGGEFRLFQDLIEGKWYREIAPSAPGQLL